MKTRLLAGLCTFASLVHAQEPAPAAPASLRVLTFNIRYENKSDGANAWVNRREAVAKQIEDQADVTGLQEVTPAQRAWLAENLPAFGVIGVGRKAKDTDESVPVLYRKDRFEPLASGTFWLSETPEVVESISWDSSLPRICTWVKLRDRKAEAGKDVIWFYNAHLDHRSGEAREKGLALVHQRMAARASAEPVILVGDFNSGAKEKPCVHLASLEKPALTSTYDALGVPPDVTFNHFSAKPVEGGAIDFIFVQKDAWKVRSGSILKTTYVDKDSQPRHLSDHFGVVAVLELKR